VDDDDVTPAAFGKNCESESLRILTNGIYSTNPTHLLRGSTQLCLYLIAALWFLVSFSPFIL
jgi:hypothetical protein